MLTFSILKEESFMFNKSLIPFKIIPILSLSLSLSLSLVCVAFATDLDEPIGAAFSPTTYKWAYTNSQPTKIPTPIPRPHQK